ncbi:MAG: biotin transporter BioY [Clostridia bacterium]|nr:biotin transporter BioY [Clostridia bacterium]
MKKRINAASLARVALGSAVIALTSWISIPAPMPYTLQTFGIFFVLCLLGGKEGLFSVAVYVLIGAVGFPVFSGFRGGLGVLIGPTGGYIMSFILSAVIFRICDAGGRRSFALRMLGSLLGMALCWIGGSLWYAATVTGSVRTGFISAALICVLPFIIPDLIKTVSAVLFAEALRRRIGRKIIG